ncbi:methionine adenosyltransferase domain-containing protein [Candidatus Uhrbacteria bacterium]|nr:methionine adenosyltransferase domain-containing protein [Candidatus Uhrbacteria bacterium]
MSLIPSVYTVECVTKGHPDRVCDQIADRILKEIAYLDPTAHVAVEVFGCKGVLTIGGEVTTQAQVDYESLAREVLHEVCYEDPIEIRIHLISQSPEIHSAVDVGGAGDQGIMYGYATHETETFMPIGVHFSRALTTELERLRESGEIPWLKSDGKVQVTIRDHVPEVIVVSTQHKADISLEEVRSVLMENLILPQWQKQRFPEPMSCRVLINPAGSWTVGGFNADSGLTGRKLAVDSYGGILPGGGGSTHGKDLSKVDCSATTQARQAAVAIVGAGLAQECLVSVAYAIGINEPVMLYALNQNAEEITHLLDPKVFLSTQLRSHSFDAQEEGR